jgi:hypothetical protein
MPLYYVMSCEGVYPATTISREPDLDEDLWMDGRKLSISVSEPLVFDLDPEYPGKMKAMYKTAVPLMSSELVEALTESGVDNLQCYPALIRNPETSEEFVNYKAVNIIGTVSCADREKSEIMDTTDSDMVDVDFESLVIDESKTKGLLLFRLAEAVNAIIVHEKVKNKIEEKGIPNMVFYEPGEWSG